MVTDFEVGDLVRIVASDPIDEDSDCEPFVGHQGEIESIHLDQNYPYRVRFDPPIDAYNTEFPEQSFRSSELEPARPRTRTVAERW